MVVAVIVASANFGQIETILNKWHEESGVRRPDMSGTWYEDLPELQEIARLRRGQGLSLIHI
eukprot:14322767-Alexandrium_andersonii.AAC.1